MIEKIWKTKAGLNAICIVVMYGERKSHRCGYVEVKKDHPLYGIGYNESIDIIPIGNIEKATLGKKSPILSLTCTAGSFEGEDIRRSPDILFDCHGGLTFSGFMKGSFVEEPELDGWLFGFDCMHFNDDYIDDYPTLAITRMHGATVRSLEYVESECESLAQQIVDMFPIENKVEL